MTEPHRAAALRLSGITKTFPGVRALNDLTFELLEGEVHALLGENGAGKSTLMAVAAGVLEPDSGTVEILGHRLERAVPARARSLGLTVVYQHPSVLDDLTVAENLLFSLPEDRRPSYRDRNSWARKQLDLVSGDIDPARRAGELSVAERQLVEIAKALALEARVVVLDEPTESLTHLERERLFEQVEALRRRGSSVVYISHRLPEVRRVADRISVLRDGQIRGTLAAADADEDTIVRLIVGRSVDHSFPAKRRAEALSSAGAASLDEEPVLEVVDLHGPRFSGVSFTVAPGEIVGLAGIEGNGQRELLRCLGGLLSHHGTVRIRGRQADTSSPSKAHRSGVLSLPSDRHQEGIFASMSVRENLSLLVLRELSAGGVVNRAKEREKVDAEIASFRVRTASAETAVGSLSGGNQQKVVIARTLLASPVVLLADEPTRGVDVGARVDIYRLLRGVADDGRAVVVASADVLELQGLCDKVLVFSRGQIVAVLSGEEVTEASITGAAITTDVDAYAPAPQSAQSAQSARSEAASRRRGRLARSDFVPSAMLGVLVVALGLVTGIGHPLFFGVHDLTSLFFLAAILVLVTMGQLTALLAASLDLSVGPLVGLTVVLVSFFVTEGAGAGGLLEGIAVAVAVGVGVGLTNAALIHKVRIGPVVSTLVTYIALQGVSLLLRPQPAGPIDVGVTSGLQASVGPFPIVFLVVVALALVAELVLRRTRAGRELRAVGSDATRAFRLGARIGPTIVVAHVVCSLFAVGAGLLLAAQVGIGDPSLGTDYTLTSLAAAVLGGASIFGGRGSFIGALLGALLISEVITATSFLGLQQAWQEWFPGLLILGGAGVYSRVRARGQGGAAAVP